MNVDLWTQLLIIFFLIDSLEKAANPEELTEATIIENMKPDEIKHMSRMRNIGIAVSFTPSVPG